MSTTTEPQRPRKTDQHVIRMDGVGVRFGRRVALREVDLTIGSGVTAVIGLNGAGKSTLLRCAAGLIRPSDGHVSWDGRRDVGFPASTRCKDAASSS